MSGYFQRLIARSMGSGSAVRPLSAQPYATLSQEKLLTGRDDQLIDTPHTANLVEGTDRAARNTTLSNEAASKADLANNTNIADTIDSPISTQHANKSAMATGKHYTKTALVNTMTDPLHDDAHETTSQHLPQEAVEARPSPSSLRQSPFARHEGDATKSNEQTIRQSAEEFHLMPFPAPNPTTILSAPFSSMRKEMDMPLPASLSTVGQYRHQATAPEPPMIQVTIGRIEIRATASPTPSRKTPVRSPGMSLEEYLKQRNGGRR